jgi:hypothetical protein
VNQAIGIEATAVSSPEPAITTSISSAASSYQSGTMATDQRIAIVSVFDKTGLLDLAKGLVQHNVRILASGGTAKMIRESGFPVEFVLLLELSI